MSEIVGNAKERRVLSREWWIVIALVTALVIGFGLTGAKAAFATSDPPPTQSIDCTAIGADYHRPLRNGDHINVEIKQANGSTGQVNVSVEQNIAGGASYNGQNNLGLRISILGSIVEETPLTLDQVMSGIITFNYAAYLKDRGVTQWTVTFVQTNSNDSWPNVECGETPPQPSPSPTPTETPSPTPTPTPTETPKPEPTPTETPKPTPTPTTTVTPTPKPTETPKPTPEPTKTPSPEPTHSPSPSPTKTPSPEPTHTPKPTETPKPSPTPTHTVTPTPKPTETPKPTPTTSPSPEPTKTPSPEPSHTAGPSPEPSSSPSTSAAPPIGPKPPSSGGGSLATTGAEAPSAAGFFAIALIAVGLAAGWFARRRRATSK